MLHVVPSAGYVTIVWELVLSWLWTKCGTDTRIQNCCSSSPPFQNLNKFPFKPLPCSWLPGPGVGSMGILLTEMNSHRLTLFIPKTALSLGLPLFQSPGFPQTPLLLALHPPLLSPYFPLPLPLPSLCLAFNSNFRHNEVVLADSLASRISVVWACCVAL